MKKRSEQLQREIRMMADKYYHKVMAEQELLVAKFILNNPTIPSEEIELVTNQNMDGMSIMVRHNPNQQ